MTVFFGGYPVEASRRIELLYTDLQSAASPLRQLAASGVGDLYNFILGCKHVLSWNLYLSAVDRSG